MTRVSQSDLIESIAGALQYISFYHPVDYITNLAQAYELEQSHAAKDAIAQILTNSRMCAEGHRPICQDTGIVTVFLKVVRSCQLEDGRRRRFSQRDRRRRAPRLARPRQQAARLDPRATRSSRAEHQRQHAVRRRSGAGARRQGRRDRRGQGRRLGEQVQVRDAQPVRLVVDWVLETLPTMGAGWCPPGMLGIGIGGTAEKAMLLAKESLMGDIDMAELKQRGAEQPDNRESCASSSTTRSTRSASARRGSAASPPCSTSRSATGRPTPPRCRSR